MERGFTSREVSGILSVSERLAQAYVEIIHEHHPEVLAGNPYFQEPSASSEVSPV